MSDDRFARHEPDETHQFSPFTDDDAPTAASNEAGPDGGPGSGGASWVSDRTEQMSRMPQDPTGGDAHRVRPPADDVTRVNPADRTARLPNVGGSGVGRTEAAARAAAGQTAPDWETRAAWSGRADVRPARPGAGGDFTRTDWAPVESEPRRVWWSPILIGVLALLLMIILGVGIWLIVQSVNDDEKVVPLVTPSVAVPATTVPATTAPSTAPASTTKPATSARATSASAGPQGVPIPALKGLSSADARHALDRVGLTYRLIFRSADAEPGTVIDSDPPEGREVPKDTQVTLVIAAPRPTLPTVGASATVQGADVLDE